MRKRIFQFTLLVGAWMAATSPAIAAEDVRAWPVLKSYTGEFLRRVKMPLGGIGTGTISLSGDGGLVDWEIMGSPNKGFAPSLGAFSYVSSFFAVRTETPDGEVKVRILQGPVSVDAYEGESGSRAFNHGFVRWRDCTFKAAYPLAQVALEDDAMPVKATLEAMNPLLPGDPDASGIPAALLRWKIAHASTVPLKVTVICFLLNPDQTATTNAACVSSEELVGVRLQTGGAELFKSGEVALALPQTCGAVSSAIDFDGQTGFDGIWRTFVASGVARGHAYGPAGGRKLAVASVAVSFDLRPGEIRRLPFALAWRFAHRNAWAGMVDGKAVDVGNWYATRYPTAFAAARDLLAHLDAYENGTIAFVESVLARLAPAVVKEAALFNLSTFRTETCFRTADGHFFSWEGCLDTAGSCFGNCSHVWGYEHALIDLWPSLAKDMTELQFGPAMDSRGCMSFRIALPLEANAAARRYDAADGHMQCIVKACENWKKMRDDAWLRRLYPRIRKAMEFTWVEHGWDGDRDGVMEGCQHNTMDVEYFGPNPQMEFLYLAALKAMAAMADRVGDASFAEECRALEAKGSAWTERNLFNGAYYEHKVVPMSVEPAVGTYPKNVPNPAEPTRQLAAGCLVDQLVGDYASRVVGLGPVADEEHAKTALDTILTKNANSNAGTSFHMMRDFAMPEEPSLRMAWYPPDRFQKSPFPYYSESMSGFEYVVAAALAQRGDFARAEQVVRDIRNRYDGRKRNPFDEAECGHHYVRALSSWSVLKAFERECRPPVTPKDGGIWPDDRGVHINAHGGGVMWHGGRYYWYGEHKAGGSVGNVAHGIAVHCYSSVDLENWKDEGASLVTRANAWHDLSDGCIVERPKVAYCPKTRKFVMYFHLELKAVPKNYDSALVGIAVSDHPTGLFTYVGSRRPNVGVWPQGDEPSNASYRHMAEACGVSNCRDGGDNPRMRESQCPYAATFWRGQTSRDQTLFVDDDGTAYHIHASEHNATLHICELADDFIRETGRYWRLAVKDWTEAPAVCKHGGWYYILGSGCTGWKPNAARYYRARSMSGPWERMGNPCLGCDGTTGLNADLTWGCQSTCIFPIKGTGGRFVAMFDRWCPTDAINGRYVWREIAFSPDGKMSISWRTDGR